VVKNSGSTIASAPSLPAPSASRSHASRLASMSATRASSWTAAIRTRAKGIARRPGGGRLLGAEALLQVAEPLSDLLLSLARLVLQGGHGGAQPVTRLSCPALLCVQPRPQQQVLRRVDLVATGEHRGDAGLRIDVVEAAPPGLRQVLRLAP